MKPAVSANLLIVGSALAVSAALAWAWLLSSPMAAESGAMVGMAMPIAPFSTAYLGSAFAMWAVMMVAMMVPSASPMILLHAKVDRAPSASARLLHTFVFALAYVLVWSAFSAAAAVIQALLVANGIVSDAALSVGERRLDAALLLAAAGYELTAAKRLCLDRCQSPLNFLHRHMRPGTAGAFRLGLLHGGYCVGCCWALMVLLFVGGVMNLAWVAILGILVVGEKIAPPAWHSERLLAAGFAVAATFYLLA